MTITGWMEVVTAWKGPIIFDFGFSVFHSQIRGKMIGPMAPVLRKLLVLLETIECYFYKIEAQKG